MKQFAHVYHRSVYLICQCWVCAAKPTNLTVLGQQFHDEDMLCKEDMFGAGDETGGVDAVDADGSSG